MIGSSHVYPLTSPLPLLLTLLAVMAIARGPHDRLVVGRFGFGSPTRACAVPFEATMGALAGSVLVPISLLRRLCTVPTFK